MIISSSFTNADRGLSPTTPSFSWMLRASSSRGMHAGKFIERYSISSRLASGISFCMSRYTRVDWVDKGGSKWNTKDIKQIYTEGRVSQSPSDRRDRMNPLKNRDLALKRTIDCLPTLLIRFIRCSHQTLDTRVRNSSSEYLQS